MTEHRLASLAIGKLADELEAAENEEFETWAAESVDQQRFFELFNNEKLLTIELERFGRIDPEKGYAKVQALIRANRLARRIRMTIWSAACTLLVVAGGLLINRLSTHRPPAATEARNGSSIGPGGTKFMMKDLSGGYMSLSTPRAGQYELGLPDGSHVWLNDSTTLRFPGTFSGSNRTVELTGEAYFNVVEDATRPFVVKLDSVRVEALGTSFDCSSYPGEGATITLLKGRVNVKTANDSALLLPNEQAIVRSDGSLSVDTNVSATLIAGWKDGYFFYNHTPLDQVMRQLTRWYDIEVVDATALSGVLYDGTINRTLPLDTLLRTLDNNQLKFQLKNRKLIILARKF